MLFEDVLVGQHQEPRRPACRIANALAKLRVDQVAHGADDVARRAELPVLAGLGNLRQQVLVDIAQHIVDIAKIGKVRWVEQLVDNSHCVVKQICAGDDEDGIAHTIFDSLDPLDPIEDFTPYVL